MGKPTVLVVEDDPIVASDIKYKLRDFGYAVPATAASGDEAIKSARQHRPGAVLMDITLEGEMDGIQAADIIRSELAIPVVFLTAHSDEATVQRAKLTLPYGYVLKPVREIELRIALEMALYNGEKQQRSAATAAPPPFAGNGSRLNEAQTKTVFSLLKPIGPFRKVPDEMLQSIAEHCSIKTYRPLEVFVMEGEDSPSDGFIVISGRVAMLKTSENGRELVVQLVGPGSTFGLLAGLDAGAHELTARAQIESTLLHVPKQCLLYLLSQLPELYPDLLAELSRRMGALQNMARSLAHDKVEVRLVAALAALLDDAETVSSAKGSNEIKMSRQELANLAGTTVETAIRITRNLEKAGILELPDHRLIRVLDPDKLRSLTEGMDS